MTISNRIAMAAFMLVIALAAIPAPARAQTAEQPPRSPAVAAKPITVGVFVNPPFVMRDGDRYTGMAIDLWQSLAARLHQPFVYQSYPSIPGLIDATSRGEVDLAVANITVNENRARRIDFTQPWFDGGLRIMVADTHHSSFRDVFDGIRNSGFLRSYAWILLAILTASLVLTIFDRRFDKAFPRRWRDGFAESFYTVMQISTTGKPAVRKNLFGWIGRIWQGIWLMAGVVVIAYVTSSVTTVMTTLALTNQIRGLEDLDGRTIGVLRGTVANEFAQREGFRHQPYAQIGDAVNALLSGEIDAIIEDAPILQYYFYTHPKADVRLVGRLFERDKYAFGLPQRSTLRLPVTVEILSAQEREEIDQLKMKYFGDEN